MCSKIKLLCKSATKYVNVIGSEVKYYIRKEKRLMDYISCLNIFMTMVVESN